MPHRLTTWLHRFTTFPITDHVGSKPKPIMLLALPILIAILSRISPVTMMSTIYIVGDKWVHLV